MQKRVLERDDRVLRKIENREKGELEKELAAQYRRGKRPNDNAMLAINMLRGGEFPRCSYLGSAKNRASGHRSKVRTKKELSDELRRASKGRSAKAAEDNGRRQGDEAAAEKTATPEGAGSRIWLRLECGLSSLRRLSACRLDTMDYIWFKIAAEQKDNKARTNTVGVTNQAVTRPVLRVRFPFEEHANG